MKMDSWLPIWVPIWVGFLTSVLSIGATQQTEMSWERDILVDSALLSKGSYSIGAFSIDSQVAASALWDLSDIRLYDANHHPIGSVIQPVYQNQKRCDIVGLPMERIQARVTDGQGFEAIYALFNSDAIPSKVNLNISDRDFEFNVSVWTAEIPKHIQQASQLNVSRLQWKLQANQALLYDYSSMVALRKESVQWSPENDRVIKIRVGGLSQSQRSTLATLSGGIGRPNHESFEVATRMLKVESIGFAGEVCREEVFAQAVDAVKLPWTQAALPQIEPEKKRSWYRFGSGGLPLHDLKFKVAPGNFMRTIQIVGRPAATRQLKVDSSQPWTWPVLAEGQLRRIQWSESTDSLLSIWLRLPERMQEIAIGIFDRDDPPLVLTEVQGEWNRQQVVFPIGQPGRYQLQYGHPPAHPFQSEFSEMFRRSRVKNILPAPLGPPRMQNQLVVEESRSWISGSTLMTIGLGIGILTLMALLFGVAKKAKAMAK